MPTCSSSRIRVTDHREAVPFSTIVDVDLCRDSWQQPGLILRLPRPIDRTGTDDLRPSALLSNPSYQPHEVGDPRGAGQERMHIL